MSARGRVVVWTDVDMTYPNDQIPELVGELDGWDQVVGARTSEQGTARFLRAPAKWFIRKLAGYLTGVRIPDLNSGFRAFRRDVGAQFFYLLPRGFSCVTTLTMAFLTNGYSVRYVPIDYFPRRGESKFHWWADTRRYLLQVVRMVLLYEPLRIFRPPGGGARDRRLRKAGLRPGHQGLQGGGEHLRVARHGSSAGSWSVCSPTCSSRSTSGATT